MEGTIVIGGVVFFGSMKFKGPTQDKILLAALACVLIGTVYTFVQMHLGPRRYFRANILLSLVKALKPLQPTHKDLAGCIERCQTLGMKIGKVAKVDEVWSRLERSIARMDS